MLATGCKKEIGPTPTQNTTRRRESAFILKKYFSYKKELERTMLQIQSPHVKAIFKAVIPQYRNINLQVRSIDLDGQLRPLFHWRNELQEYGSRVGTDPVAVQHLTFVLEYMYRELGMQIFSYSVYVEMALHPSASCIEYQDLWMVFRPGDYVHSIGRYGDAILKFESMEMHMHGPTKWILSAIAIDYDGTNFGQAMRRVEIGAYEGVKELNHLPATPLQYHPRQTELRERMITRGKKFVMLHGRHHRMYKGIAEVLGPEREHTFHGEEDQFPLQSTLVQSRIMVDVESFSRARPTHRPCIHATKHLINTTRNEHLFLTEDDYLICHSLIAGFSLGDKTWCLFKVELIEDVDYNVGAFDSLVLEDDQKQMIRSLVNVHMNESISFDDVIKGKGKGMIFLLHGVPGVGKTLTAESVSDICGKPLYSITAGTLGETAESVEKSLETALRLATAWNAITLIDEADVFLEQRTAHDLKRNSLVSVFLRCLEYYEGIMFLTTNRIGAFDTAFKSRIHLAIKYPNLSFDAREKLWETFIMKASRGESPHWLYSSIVNLARENVNGRQIKNIVRTAHAIATSNQTEMSLSHINMALAAMKNFESDIKEDREKMATESEGILTEIEERSSKRRRYD